MQKTEENSFRDEEPPLDEKDFDTHEEEIRNKYLLEKLKEEQTRHREFVKQLEIEKRVTDIYSIIYEDITLKELFATIREKGSNINKAISELSDLIAGIEE